MKDDKDLRIEELESEKKEWIERHHNALKYAESNLDKLTATTQALDAAVEALEYYADQNSWIGYHRDCTSILNDDVKAKASDDFDIIIGGKRARESLAKIKALKGEK